MLIKVAFPDNYSTGVMYLSIDKAESKQVHQLYAMPEAFAAARKDQPMPSGTVFTVVRYAAQLDAQGNPIKGADGQFVKGELLGYANSSLCSAARSRHARWRHARSSRSGCSASAC